jgi:hypothetical protein
MKKYQEKHGKGVSTMGRRFVSDDINDDLMQEKVEDALEYKPVNRDKPKRKRLKRFFSFLFGVILIPTVMSIVLTAYEGKAKEWVWDLLGIEQAKETEMDQLKRLVKDGNLIHYDCGVLGSTVRGVVENCGEPALSRRTIFSDGTTQTLGYQKGDHHIILLDFNNERLKRISVIDNMFQSTTLDDIRRTFGVTNNKPFEFEKTEGKEKIKTQTYTYNMEGGQELKFTVRKDNKKLLQIEIEDPKQYPHIKKYDPYNRVHRAPAHKEASGGMDAVLKLKAAFDKGDMINYDCGPLGSSLAEVYKKCGALVSAKGYDMGEETQYVNWAFKNREIKTKFYRGVLASISVNTFSYSEKNFKTVERPSLAITPEQVKQVFGKPMQEKESTLFDTKSLYLTYKIDGKEITFSFSENKCRDIWLRRADMFEPNFGYIKREFKEKQTYR